MSNPTANFGWTHPTRDIAEDSWTVYGQAWDQVDISVNSVAAEVTRRLDAGDDQMVQHETILFPVALTNDRLVLINTGSAWVVCSLSTYGRLVGSFTLVSSGAHAFIEWSTYAYTNPGGPFGNGTSVEFRAVVKKTGVNTIALPTAANAGWKSYFNFHNVRMPMPTFTEIASLGPGTYSLELQARASFGTSTCSTVYVQGGDSFRFSIREVRVPR